MSNHLPEHVDRENPFTVQVKIELTDGKTISQDEFKTGPELFLLMCASKSDVEGYMMHRNCCSKSQLEKFHNALRRINGWEWAIRHAERKYGLEVYDCERCDLRNCCDPLFPACLEQADSDSIPTSCEAEKCPIQ